MLEISSLKGEHLQLSDPDPNETYTINYVSTQVPQNHVPFLRKILLFQLQPVLPFMKIKIPPKFILKLSSFFE